MRNLGLERVQWAYRFAPGPLKTVGLHWVDVGGLMKRQIVGGVMITGALGLFAIAVLGIGPGLICTFFILFALVVADNIRFAGLRIHLMAFRCIVLHG